MLKVAPYKTAKYSFTSRETEKAGQEPAMTAQKKYNDPLMNWPARGLAYSNEIGAAISEVAPKLGALLWWPAMLYFGADIYDKYKNDKMSYDPNGYRGTQQAIFQLLASVLLPTAAVHAGQKTASFIGKASKDKMSLQAKEEVANFTLEYMKRHKLYKYQNKIDEYKNAYFASLDNYVSDKMHERKLTKPLKLIRDALFGSKHPEAMGSNKEKVHKYAEAQIDRIFKLREQLVKNEKPKEFSNRLFQKFKKIKELNLKNPEFKDMNVDHAAKYILKQFEKNQIMKIKMWKTLGGFAALGLMIKPIDMFVEKTIMKKYVEPKLSKFERQEVNKFKDNALAEKN